MYVLKYLAAINLAIENVNTSLKYFKKNIPKASPTQQAVYQIRTLALPL